MKTRFSSLLAAAVASTALVFSAAATAGVIDKAAGKLQERSAEQKAPKKAPSGNSQPSGGAKRSQPSAQGSRGNRSGNAFGGLAPAPKGNAHESRPGSADNNRPRNGGRNADGNRDRGDRGQSQGLAQRPKHDLNDDLGRLYGNNSNRGNDRGHDGRSRGDRHDHRPPRVVERLPAGYRDYYWNGTRYYFHGGHWYRPYGASYITVGIPFGLFVTTLPGYYTSFWLDGTRYYYSDHTYYLYEPERHGYVVTHSPYGDDEDYADETGDDLYIYPAAGQSEQQQADDRYACHRWAVDQSDYDPLDDEYDADLRADYRRAMTACLTGRGYTVN